MLLVVHCVILTAAVVWYDSFGAGWATSERGGGLLFRTLAMRSQNIAMNSIREPEARSGTLTIEKRMRAL